MSQQECIENKNISIKKTKHSKILLDTTLIIISIFAFYLIIALASFNPYDPSWSQATWHVHIHNLGGKIGAWIADTLFLIFGLFAYALPPIILLFCWNSFIKHNKYNCINLFNLSLRFIGLLILLLTSCGLAELNIDDIYYFTSGGVIGNLLNNAILPWLNSISTTLVLLCIWLISLTLLTGWSWLTIMEKIGAVVLTCTTFISNRNQRNDKVNNYHR